MAAFLVSSWQKYKEWLAVFVLIILMTIFTTWYFFLNPPRLYFYLAIVVTAIGFIVIITLQPKYRKRLIKRVSTQRLEPELHKELEWLRGYILSAGISSLFFFSSIRLDI